MPVTKSTDYWDGFADGQRDMETQHAQETDTINPNEFVHSLDLFAGWLMGMIQNNGSDELNDEGAPMFANYSEPTIAMIISAFAHARLLRVVSACIFKLNQGDFTEEHFHHELNNAMDRLDQEADESSNE